MVADMAAEKKIFFLADMLLHMVADKVAGMVAVMRAGMVADMGAKKNCSWMTWSWTWWPTRR